MEVEAHVEGPSLEKRTDQPDYLVCRRDVNVTAASPAEFLDIERRSHPLAIAAFEVLERTDRNEMAEDQLRQILEKGNEDRSAFRSTSRYVVVTATGRTP